MRTGRGTRKDAPGCWVLVLGTISFIAVPLILQWLFSQWGIVPLLVIVVIAGFAAFWYWRSRR